jgi:hypothetical protein
METSILPWYAWVAIGVILAGAIIYAAGLCENRYWEFKQRKKKVIEEEK